MPGKLEKYRDIALFPNVIESDLLSFKPFRLSRYWDGSAFPRRQPITLEIGCGKGDYTVALAERHRDRNFVGLDIKGVRLWHGARRAIDGGLDNVLFLRMNALAVAQFFPAESIADIWIPFPDPFRKRSRRNAVRRLTAGRYLDLYRRILAPGGMVHLKTDDEELYQYSLESVGAAGGRIVHRCDDLYGTAAFGEAKTVQTHFEARYRALSRNIRYLAFSFAS